MTLTVGFASTLTPLGAAERATDWAQFRGPQRSGHAATSIPAGASVVPVERWRRPLGAGFSGVLIVGDSLFTQTSDGERELLVKLSAETGDEVWRLAVGSLFENSWGDGPRSIPTYRDGQLFALGSFGRLVSADAATGRELWRVELGRISGVSPPDFGYSPAPLLFAGAVLTEVGASDGGLVRAFDRETGEELWAVETGRAGYSTPITIELTTGERLAVFLTREAAVALTAKGEVAWRWPLKGGSPYDLPQLAAHDEGGGAIGTPIEPRPTRGVRWSCSARPTDASAARARLGGALQRPVRAPAGHRSHDSPVVCAPRGNTRGSAPGW